MNRKDFLEWKELHSYICENIIDNHNITKNMICEIKALMEYINSDSDEKMDYSDLHELFKQCTEMINETIRNNEYSSDDEKFSKVCDCIKNHFQLMFGVPQSYLVQSYYNKPASTLAHVSANIPYEIDEAYKKKLKEIKQRENVTKYREFTQLGAYSTYLFAVAKGLIDFKRYGNQLYLVVNEGLLVTEEEIELLMNGKKVYESLGKGEQND